MRFTILSSILSESPGWSSKQTTFYIQTAVLKQRAFGVVLCLFYPPILEAKLLNMVDFKNLNTKQMLLHSYIHI